MDVTTKFLKTQSQFDNSLVAFFVVVDLVEYSITITLSFLLFCFNFGEFYDFSICGIIVLINVLLLTNYYIVILHYSLMLLLTVQIAQSMVRS